MKKYIDAVVELLAKYTPDEETSTPEEQEEYEAGLRAMDAIIATHAKLEEMVYISAIISDRHYNYLVEAEGLGYMEALEKIKETADAVYERLKHINWDDVSMSRDVTEFGLPKGAWDWAEAVGEVSKEMLHGSGKVMASPLLSDQFYGFSQEWQGGLTNMEIEPNAILSNAGYPELGVDEEFEVYCADGIAYGKSDKHYAKVEYPKLNELSEVQRKACLEYTDLDSNGEVYKSEVMMLYGKITLLENR